MTRDIVHTDAFTLQARVSGKRAQKVETVRAALAQTRSEFVKTAIDRYIDEVLKDPDVLLKELERQRDEKLAAIEAFRTLIDPSA